MQQDLKLLKVVPCLIGKYGLFKVKKVIKISYPRSLKRPFLFGSQLENRNEGAEEGALTPSYWPLIFIVFVRNCFGIPLRHFTLTAMFTHHL